MMESKSQYGFGYGDMFYSPFSTTSSCMHAFNQFFYNIFMLGLQSIMLIISFQYIYGLMYLNKKYNLKSTPHIRKYPDKIHDYPIISEYTYLGIRFNNFGKITPHDQKIQKTVNFITTKIRRSSQKCKLRKKILLWKCYIRPYFLYIAPIIDLIPASLKNHILRLWKLSFKKVCHFPKATPDQIIYRYTDDPNEWIDYTSSITQNKIIARGLIPNNPEALVNTHNKPATINGKTLHSFPNNFTKIFAFSQHICKIHNTRIDYLHFLQHANISLESYNELFSTVERKDKTRIAQKKLIRSNLENEINKINLNNFGYEEPQNNEHNLIQIQINEMLPCFQLQA